MFIGVDYLSVAPVPSYEPGTGAGLANVPFYGLGSLESAPRVITAGNRVVLVPGVGRVDAWRNERRIDRRPIDGRDLLRAIAALGEHGTVRKARPVRLARIVRTARQTDSGTDALRTPLRPMRSPRGSPA